MHNPPPAPAQSKAVRLLAGLLVVYACLPLVLGVDKATELLGPLAPEYMREQVPLLAAHTMWDWTHRVGGTALIVAGLIQLQGFSRWHKALGRLYAALAVLIAVGGGWMACTAPFSAEETLPALVFAGLLLTFVVLGIAAIRANRLASHRRWMTRSFALVLGPLFVRIMHMVLTSGLTEREAMAPAFWIGWSLPLLVLEIRGTGFRERA